MSLLFCTYIIDFFFFFFAEVLEVLNSNLLDKN